ncbi:MAG: galactose-1-phosphate uridylyltransferase [Candidatus Sumerlaeales bacterium]|nr:galactose-1-phosphate uridylyltransferase [Candidatus Sumerlaeales bacterium]
MNNVTPEAPELRKDPVTGRWVIIARERAKRPQQISGISLVKHSHSNDFCPFCPGHENETPPEVLSYRSPNTQKDSEGWWVRVVPNKYPALISSTPCKKSAHGIYDRMNGYGVHEVLIESPHHCHTFAELPTTQIQEILWAMRDRTVELRKLPNIKYVLIFKNWGSEAGASIEHPHSQIIGLPVVPMRVMDELSGASKYFEFKERCVFCDIIQQELSDKTRIVAENDSFLAYMPFASRFPYESCIIPKEHTSYYVDVTKNQVNDLSTIIKDLFSLYKQSLGNIPYNFMFHTAPLSKSETNNYYHWHIEVIPKLSTVAGFEWGSGFHINVVAPEDAAKHLCEAKDAKTALDD